jgi:glutathione peroxidase
MKDDKISKVAFDFEFESLTGGALPLSRFAGHPLLVINTASKCGFTPQYAGIEALWQRYRDRGLVVLGVPSNDFGQQEPGDSSEITGFCQKNYGVDFPMAAKVHVKGPEAHPLFRWFTEQGAGRPRWNFYKYLIGSDGRLRTWYSSITRPNSRRFERAIAGLVEGP